MEKELKALADRTAAKEDVSYLANRLLPPSHPNRHFQVTRLRAEMKKLYDGLHIGALIYHPSSLYCSNGNRRVPRSAVDRMGTSCVTVLSPKPILTFF